MSTIVIMPGGFHPYHAGHASLYNSAKKAFPDADVYVAATNDTKTRPFPFSIKEKLARIAGVPAGHFVQVKSPFKADEITSKYNPNKDVLVFVRSEKDKNEQPKPGGTKKDGSPSYFQPYDTTRLQPFSKHAYIAYLPTVEFGPGITSASEIRNMWPNLSVKEKGKLVAQLYPNVLEHKNAAKLLANIVKMLDAGMADTQAQSVTEGENWSKHNNKRAGGMSKKSVRVYRREHPGSKIQTAVTTTPSKLKKGSKAAKRRASFCARMRGMKKHRTGAKKAHDPNSNINKSLRRWHCESIEEMRDLIMIAEQKIASMKQGMAEGEMKPTHISGKKISGYVETLEKALLKAKTRGIKLKYNKIDKIMQLISQAHHITGDTLHNDFVKKHHMIPDKWIVKQQIAEGLTKHPDYLSEK